MAQLAPDQSPCLDLPAAAFTGPRLLTSCPHCSSSLKFSPFFAAADDYANVLRRGLESLRSHGKAESQDALGHLKALAAHLASIGQGDQTVRYAQEADALAARIAH